MYQDLHIHTNYSDGANTPREMIEEAIAGKLDVIGISDHSYTPFDTSYCMKPSEIDLYKKEITGLKKEYADRITVRCGIEQDYYSQTSTEGFDYVIGSVHYVKLGSEYIPMDESSLAIKDAADKYFDGDVMCIAERYFENVSDMALQLRPDIIGHFDLISKFVEQSDILDTDDPRYVRAWQKAALSIIKLGIPFEINSGAISRGYRTTPYPDSNIRKFIIENGGRLVCNSDAHDKAYIGGCGCVFEDNGGRPFVHNDYVGRGIAVGLSEDGKNLIICYFLSGRSRNSQNRILMLDDGALYTRPYIEALVEDPSLIIYCAMRDYDGKSKHIIVSNGDHTDTMIGYLAIGKSSTEALYTRCYEPDAPNYTPRISADIRIDNSDVSYTLSIIKKKEEKPNGQDDATLNMSDTYQNKGDAEYLFYRYDAVPGKGHLIYTYEEDGDPIPSFKGEPRSTMFFGDIDDIAYTFWNSLNEKTRISLCVRTINLKDGKSDYRIINKNEEQEK